MISCRRTQCQSFYGHSTFEARWKGEEAPQVGAPYLWRIHVDICPYITTGKTISLTRRTFVGKVTSLLFNMLSRLVITFLPMSKRLLISWLQSPSAVILEPPKIKSDTVSTVSLSISHEVMGPDAVIFVF